MNKLTSFLDKWSIHYTFTDEGISIPPQRLGYTKTTDLFCLIIEIPNLFPRLNQGYLTVTDSKKINGQTIL